MEASSWGSPGYGTVGPVLRMDRVQGSGRQRRQRGAEAGRPGPGPSGFQNVLHHPLSCGTKHTPYPWTPQPPPLTRGRCCRDELTPVTCSEPWLARGCGWTTASSRGWRETGGREGSRWPGVGNRVRVGVHVEEAAGAPCGEEMGPEESACRGGSGGLGRGAALVAYVRPLPPERPLCHL